MDEDGGGEVAGSQAWEDDEEIVDFVIVGCSEPSAVYIIVVVGLEFDGVLLEVGVGHDEAECYFEEHACEVEPVGLFLAEGVLYVA